MSAGVVDFLGAILENGFSGFALPMEAVANGFVAGTGTTPTTAPLEAVSGSGMVELVLLTAGVVDAAGFSATCGCGFTTAG